MKVTSTLMASCSAHDLWNFYVNYFEEVRKNLCNYYVIPTESKALVK
jgi:hypothetical protein